MSELLQNTTFTGFKDCQLLTKTHVLQGKLLVNDKVQKANNLRKPEIAKTCTTALLVSLLSTCQPSYAIATHYQPLNNHSFNYVDVVAVNGNNDRQERKKLPVAVKHHTIVDVFFCLSFASLPVMGELCLALALVRLWWGGGGNKPFIRRIPSAVLQRFLTLPAALILGRIKKISLPVRKVL
jgi:hypothetical protein